MSRRRLFKKMLSKALRKDGKIYPCGSKETLKETFCINEDSCAILQYQKENGTGGCIICPLTKKAYDKYKEAITE